MRLSSSLPSTERNCISPQRSVLRMISRDWPSPTKRVVNGAVHFSVSPLSKRIKALATPVRPSVSQAP